MFCRLLCSERATESNKENADPEFRTPLDIPPFRTPAQTRPPPVGRSASPTQSRPGRGVGAESTIASRSAQKQKLLVGTGDVNGETPQPLPPMAQLLTQSMDATSACMLTPKHDQYL